MIVSKSIEFESLNGELDSIEKARAKLILPPDWASVPDQSEMRDIDHIAADALKSSEDEGIYVCDVLTSLKCFIESLMFALQRLQFSFIWLKGTMNAECFHKHTISEIEVVPFSSADIPVVDWL